jgi:dCTP deaminase
MTILSDRSIKQQIELGHIGIDPYEAAHVQPASIDLRLDNAFLVFNPHRVAVIRPFEEQNLTRMHQIEDGESFYLTPGQFVLGATFECITLPDDIVGRVEGKSSLGRLGLEVHSTAGFIDPGFLGHITLELSNNAPLPIELIYGMKIGQIAFEWLDGSAEHPYGSSELGSKYFNQRGPTASRYHLNARPDVTS